MSLYGQRGGHILGEVGASDAITGSLNCSNHEVGYRGSTFQCVAALLYLCLQPELLDHCSQFSLPSVERVNETSSAADDIAEHVKEVGNSSQLEIVPAKPVDLQSEAAQTVTVYHQPPITRRLTMAQPRNNLPNNRSSNNPFYATNRNSPASDSIDRSSRLYRDWLALPIKQRGQVFDHNEINDGGFAAVGNVMPDSKEEFEFYDNRSNFFHETIVSGNSHAVLGNTPASLHLKMEAQRIAAEERKMMYRDYQRRAEMVRPQQSLNNNSTAYPAIDAGSSSRSQRHQQPSTMFGQFPYPPAVVDLDPEPPYVPAQVRDEHRYADTWYEQEPDSVEPRYENDYTYDRAVNEAARAQFRSNNPYYNRHTH